MGGEEAARPVKQPAVANDTRAAWVKDVSARFSCPLWSGARQRGRRTESLCPCVDCVARVACPSPARALQDTTGWYRCHELDLFYDPDSRLHFKLRAPEGGEDGPELVEVAPEDQNAFGALTPSGHPESDSDGIRTAPATPTPGGSQSRVSSSEDPRTTPGLPLRFDTDTWTGRKDSNEDRFVHGQPMGQLGTYFGVYDGHAGAECAEYAVKVRACR